MDVGGFRLARFSMNVHSSLPLVPSLSAPLCALRRSTLPLWMWATFGLWLAGGLSLAHAYQVQTTAKQAGNKVARWYTLPVKVELHLDGAPTVKDGSDLRAIRAALQTWSQPNCNNLTFTTELTNNTSFAGRRKDPQDPLSEFTRDGKSVIRFETNTWEWSKLELARNATYFEPQTGAIKEADLLLNAVDFQWSTDQSVGTLDIQTVVLARAGFMIGLWFSDVPGALLHANTDLRSVQRTLTQDDTNGSCFLYPPGGWTNPPPPAPGETPPQTEPPPSTQEPSTPSEPTTSNDAGEDIGTDGGTPENPTDGTGCQCSHASPPPFWLLASAGLLLLGGGWRRRRRTHHDPA